MKHLLLLYFIFASTTTMFAEPNKIATNPLLNKTEISSPNVTQVRSSIAIKNEFLHNKLAFFWNNITKDIKIGFNSFTGFINWLLNVWLFELVLLGLAIIIILLSMMTALIIPEILFPLILGLIIFFNTTKNSKATLEENENLLPLQEKLFYPSEERITTPTPLELKRNKDIIENNSSGKELLELLPGIDDQLLPNITESIENNETPMKEQELTLKNNDPVKQAIESYPKELEPITEILIPMSESIAPITELLEDSLLKTTPNLNDSRPLSKTVKEAPSELEQLNSLEEIEVNVYPNPSNGPLTITIKNKDNIENNTNILFYSSSGQLLFKETMVDKKVLFNLSEYAPGVYLIKIFDGQNTITKRLIKR